MHINSSPLYFHWQTIARKFSDQWRLKFPGWAMPTLIFSRVGACPPCSPRAGAYALNNDDETLTAACSLFTALDESWCLNGASITTFISRCRTIIVSRSQRSNSFNRETSIIISTDYVRNQTTSKRTNRVKCVVCRRWRWQQRWRSMEIDSLIRKPENEIG